MTLWGLFRELKREEPGRFFAEFFTSLTKSAFRLEMLDYYSIPSELDELKKYRAGQTAPPPDSADQGWPASIRSAIRRGVDFHRVRLYRQPISEYLKYEIAWGYRVNVPAGEKLSCIKYEESPEFETQVPILKDYWLLDDNRCFLMEYDFLGQFLGISVVPQEHIESYVRLKSELLRKSTPIQDTELWKFAQ